MQVSSAVHQRELERKLTSDDGRVVTFRANESQHVTMLETKVLSWGAKEINNADLLKGKVCT
jgi:hypothetical protein